MSKNTVYEVKEIDRRAFRSISRVLKKGFEVIDRNLINRTDYLYALTNYSVQPECIEKGMPYVVQLGKQLPFGKEKMDEDTSSRIDSLETVVRKMNLNLKLGIQEIDGKTFYVGIVSDPNYKPGRKAPKITT